MSDADDLAVIQAARERIAEHVEVLSNALEPVFDAAGADTDSVYAAVGRLWNVDDELAVSQRQVHPDE